jgi:hypothetical protein
MEAAGGHPDDYYEHEGQAEPGKQESDPPPAVFPLTQPIERSAPVDHCPFELTKTAPHEGGRLALADQQPDQLA